MRRRVLIVALSLACIPHSAQAFLLAVPAPARLCLRLSAPAQSGEPVFGAQCAAGHSLEQAAVEKYQTGGFDEKAAASRGTRGTRGRSAVPLFAERLSEAEVGLVAAYVIRSAEDGWD